MVVTNVLSGQTLRFIKDDSREEFNHWLASTKPTIVGHNILSFDVPALNRLWSSGISFDCCVDTLVLSYLGDPAREGGHSLDSWGARLGVPKIEFNDWSNFSQEMLTYCERDVELNVLVFKHLCEEMSRFSELSCEIEHKTRVIIDEQQTKGVWFDVEAARDLRDRLRAREAELTETIHEVFPPRLVVKNTYNYRVKADGSPYASYLRHVEEYPKLQFNRSGTKYRVFDWQTFNIGSPSQRVERLLQLGWKPRNFTPKGNPKVDEESLLSFAEKTDNKAVEAMAEWLVCNGRANMLENWLGAVQDDQRIHGRVFSCGAGTRRMRHTNPNTANIPGNAAPYGRECRALWGVAADSGRRFLGCDAKGLEGRVMVHYLGEPAAVEYFLNGDAHTANAKAIGYERGPTKNIFYAFLYGATDKKLGSMVGKGVAEGARIRAALEANIPGLARLIADIKKEYTENKGWLETIDGGWVKCPSPHAALNYKFQSAGAIFMKRAAIILKEWLGPYDAHKVLDVHDEWQFDVAERHAHQVGDLMVKAMQQAGRDLGFTVPMDGDYKIGRNWSMTH